MVIPSMPSVLTVETEWQVMQDAVPVVMPTFSP
jgi:hypothetical protein